MHNVHSISPHLHKWHSLSLESHKHRWGGGGDGGAASVGTALNPPHYFLQAHLDTSLHCGSPGSPVNQYLIVGAVVLQLVHFHARGRLADRPLDQGRGGGHVGHQHSPFRGAFGRLPAPTSSTSAAGLAGAGDVREAGLGGRRPAGAVAEVRQLDDGDLHRGRGLPGGIGGDAGEGAAVLRRGDENVQGAIVIHGGPGGIPHQAVIGGHPVDEGAGVPDGLALERGRLALQDKQLVRVLGDEWRFAHKLLLAHVPEVAALKAPRGAARLQVVVPLQPAEPEKLTVTVQGVAPETKGQGWGEGRGGQS